MKSVLALVIFCFGIATRAKSEMATIGNDSCLNARLEKNLKEMGTTRTSVKPVEFQDRCDAKNFCFKIETIKPLVFGGYKVPVSSYIEYCEKEGLRVIDARGNGEVSKDSLISVNGILFRGKPGEICSYTTAQPYKTKFMKDGSLVGVELPADSGLYFSEGNLTHFVSPIKTKLAGLSIEKDKTYKIANGIVSENKDGSVRRQCLSTREPENVDLLNALEKYGIEEKDLKDIQLNSECSAGDGNLEGPQKGINAFSKNKIETRVLVIPSEAWLGFCNGYLASVSRATNKEVKIWGHRCNGGFVPFGLTVDKENQKYMCKLFAPLKIGTSIIPAGVNIVFNPEQVLTIVRDYDDPTVQVINGKPFESGSYGVENGKLIWSAF